MTRNLSKAWIVKRRVALMLENRNGTKIETGGRYDSSYFVFASFSAVSGAEEI